MREGAGGGRLRFGVEVTASYFSMALCVHVVSCFLFITVYHGLQGFVGLPVALRDLRGWQTFLV